MWNPVSRVAAEEIVLFLSEQLSMTDSLATGSTRNRIPILFLPVWIGLLLLPAISWSQPAYFQQDVSYDIRVTLDDSKHELTGNIQIVYKNNSPDTLNFIFLHLWPNAYSDRNTALSRQLLVNDNSKLYFSKTEDRGFIDQLDFKVNDIAAVFKFDSLHNDFGKLKLNRPLLPGDNITITTPFHIKLPDNRISRMGHNGDAYQVSQWYPKPAVYDRSGWHPMTYLDQGEFYSEFGTFKVAITLPENYVVAATGELQEASEKEWLQRKVMETEAIVDYDTAMSFPPSSSVLKTITFIQDSIHDFAWFADKRFHVLKRETVVKGNDNPVTCWIYFTNIRPKVWKKGLDILEKGIQYYSDRIGAYPYRHVTAVDGTITAGGGMEYPMITVVGKPSNYDELEHVIVHEAGHNWFYGILASNERDHPWMDEGINSYYEMAYILDRKRDENADVPKPLENTNKFGISISSLQDLFRVGFESSAFDHSDQPANLEAADFTYYNYGTVLYGKSALAFQFLEDYLGKEEFDRVMKIYFQTWKFRHPQPQDIRKVFETETGKNLSWFFDGLMGSIEPADFHVDFSDNNTGTVDIEVTNKSKLSIPAKIRIPGSPAQWYDGFAGSMKIAFPDNDSIVVFINEGYEALLKVKTTRYRDRKVFSKMPQLKVRMIPELKPEESSETLLLLPMVAWNRYNEFMAGAVFSNFGFIPRKFEYTLVPLYDFRNSDLAGTGSLNYSIWPLNGLVKDLRISVSGKRFAYSHNTLGDDSADEERPVLRYSRVVPGVEVKLRKKNSRSTLQHALAFRNISIGQDEVAYTRVDTVFVRSNVTSSLNFNELSWRMVNHRMVDPYHAQIIVEQGKDHVKAGGELNYRFSYARRKKGLDIRFFAGGFIYNKLPPEKNYKFRMSGWEGSNDYLFDEMYFGRTDDQGLWKQQFLVRDGGFKIPTFVGQSNNWIASLNIIADIPVPIPISVYGDIGTYEGISTVFQDLDNHVMYDAGIACRLIRDVVEVYIPLFYSDDINTAFEANDISFAEQIRFVFNINKMTPEAFRKNFYDQR